MRKRRMSAFCRQPTSRKRQRRTTHNPSLTLPARCRVSLRFSVLSRSDGDGSGFWRRGAFAEHDELREANRACNPQDAGAAADELAVAQDDLAAVAQAGDAIADQHA